MRFPLKGTMHEHFQPGRKTGLKLLIDQPGRSLELYFYLTARLDGKTKRIEKIGKSILHRVCGSLYPAPCLWSEAYIYIYIYVE